MSKKKEEKKTPERAFSYYPNYYSSVAITMYYRWNFQHPSSFTGVIYNHSIGIVPYWNWI